MKYCKTIFWAIIVMLCSCTSSSSDKENELLQRENAVLKKELELQKSQAPESPKKVDPIEKQVPEPDWNYSGLIGPYKIKCKLVFETSDNNYWNPVTGYYFYESKNEMIIVRGEWHNKNLKIFFSEFVNDTKGAMFQGKVDDPVLKKVIAGTWTLPGKNYGFTLNAR
jgi:hypothetical protein